jgi:hypothetical protein
VGQMFSDVTLLTCICLRSRLFRMTLEISRAACPIRDVTPGPLSATDTCIVYHVTHFEASRNVILHTRYVSTCVVAIRCGACYYSIVLNVHRVASMADNDIVLLLCVSVIFF